MHQRFSVRLNAISYSTMLCGVVGWRCQPCWGGINVSRYEAVGYNVTQCCLSPLTNGHFNNEAKGDIFKATEGRICIFFRIKHAMFAMLLPGQLVCLCPLGGLCFSVMSRARPVWCRWPYDMYMCNMCFIRFLIEAFPTDKNKNN